VLLIFEYDKYEPAATPRLIVAELQP